MAIVIADSFTEAADTNLESHTPNTGTGWTLAAGAAGAALIFSTTGTLRARTTTASYYTSNPEPGSANTYVQFRLKTLSAAFPSAYSCLRLVDNTNFIGWRLAGTGATGRRLSKNVAGTITDLITGQGVDEEWIKIEASGNTIKLFEGGTGATPTWTQVGTDQTVTDHNTEVSIGFQIGSAATVDWIDEYEGGTLSSDVTAALTGQSVPASQGTVTASVEVALTGQSVTAELGTVAVETGVTAALTGQSATVELGNVAPAVVSAITGQSVTAAQGTVAATVAHALTGQSVSIALGGVSPAVVVAVTGQSITASQGTVEVDGGVVAALTGQGLILSSGSVLAEVGSAITGQSVTAELGSVAVYDGNVSMALTGQSVAVIGGSAHPVISAGITGQDIYFEQGSVSASVLVAAMLSAPRSIYSNTQTARRSNTQTARRPRA